MNSKKVYEEVFDTINFHINCHEKARKIINEIDNKIIIVDTLLNKLKKDINGYSRCFLIAPINASTLSFYNENWFSEKEISKFYLLSEINQFIYTLQAEKIDTITQIFNIQDNITEFEQSKLVDRLYTKRLLRLKNLIYKYNSQYQDYIFLKNAIISEDTILVKGKINYIYPIHYIVLFIIILFILLTINTLISSRKD